jgi:hypothetical protein
VWLRFRLPWPCPVPSRATFVSAVGLSIANGDATCGNMKKQAHARAS